MDAALKPARLSPSGYLGLVWGHYRKHWKAYTLPLAVLIVAQCFVRIDVNLTDSLPDRVFLTVKGAKSNIRRGDYIAFDYQGTGPASPFPKGFHFVKIVGAVPGDVVTMDAHRGFYAGRPGDPSPRFLGLSKPVSKTGKPLDPGPTGTIPEGEYYVFAPHKDSLDSRYALTGWVKDEHILGKTIALF